MAEGIEKNISAKMSLDDTQELTCYIENAQKNGDHMEYILRVQRGPLKENSWQVLKRYSDFDNLVTQLKISNIDLPLPPKKVFGNFDREFIAVRQRGLEQLLFRVLDNHLLSCSIATKRFLDPSSYNTNFLEIALQHVSMLFRSEPNWDVVEAFNDAGWRLRKSFIQVKPLTQPKHRQMLSWSEHGPDGTIPGKELTALMKVLTSIQHPYIYPTVFATSNENGGIVIQSFEENGSLRDMICKCKPKGHFLKKYGCPKSTLSLNLGTIKTFGKQILEALKFLQDKGFPYGHLHAGNVVVEGGTCRLLDLDNWLLGLPSYYRPFFLHFKKIQDTDSIDVYCFGHLLYEMSFGQQLNTACCDNFPASCPPHIRSVLESILTTEACKNGLPTVTDLLSHPLFSDVSLGVMEKPQLKVPSKLKEFVRAARFTFQQRLKEEQKLIAKVKRLSKAKEFHMSEEEKKKRRKSRKKAIESESGDLEPTPHTSPSTPTSQTSQTQTTASHVSSTTVPTKVPTISPPPPPPPPPPSGHQSPMGAAPTLPPPPATASSGRGALLSSISGFSKGGLKKVQTVDKSAPKL